MGEYEEVAEGGYAEGAAERGASTSGECVVQWVRGKPGGTFNLEGYG